MCLRTAHHALAPPILDDRLRGFGARPVETIERIRRQVEIELRAIGRELGLQSVEHFFGKAARIGRRLHHQRRHRADQRSLGHPAFAMPPQIMGDLAAAGGMTNVHGSLQIKMRRQSRKVIGIVIHVMTVARLGGPTVASSVMGDDAITVSEEEQHLRVPVIGRQRPAVAEHDGLALAPVLVKDLDVVFGRDGRHGTLSSLQWERAAATMARGRYRRNYTKGVTDRGPPGPLMLAARAAKRKKRAWRPAVPRLESRPLPPLEVDAFVDRQAEQVTPQTIQPELDRAGAHPVAATYEARLARDRGLGIGDADAN